MGLYRRGKIWWLTFADIDGRQRRESSMSSNKRVAAQVLEIRKSDVREGRLGLPRSRTPKLREFGQELLKSLPNDNTRDRYSASLKKLEGFLGNIHVSQITTDGIHRYQQQRLAGGTSAATINRDRAFLHRLLQLCKKRRFIARNPCSDIEPLHERKFRRIARPLTFFEEQRLVAAAKPFLRTLIVLLVETGLRAKKEALTLEWDQIFTDEVHPYIEIRASKTHAGARRIGLTPYCVSTLQMWKTRSENNGSKFVFPSLVKPGSHLVDYRAAWGEAVKASGLRDRRIYDLRATFASRMNSGQTSPLTIAQLLGHASTSILPTYVKPLDSNMRTAILELARVRDEFQRHSLVQ